LPDGKFRLFNLRRISREEKKKILDDFFGESTEYSRYFNNVSTLFRIAEFAILFSLAVFLIVSALGNLTGISYTNAEYIIRNFALELESNKNVSTELVFNPDTDMDFALFSGGLAVSGNTGVSVFSATGTRTLYDSEDFVSPVIRASDKYTLVFESAGTEYYIYNQFSRVYSGHTTYPITGACIADNGNYVLIGKADGYTSAASVYDSDFNLVNRFLMNGFIVSAELDKEGGMYAMASVDIAEDGRYECEILRVTVGDSSADNGFVFEDIMPLSVEFGDDEIFVLCTDRLIICGFDGTDKEIKFGEGSPEAFSVSEGFACVVLKGQGATSAQRRILTVSGDGQYSEADFSAVFCQLSSFGNRAFILTEKGISVYDGEDVSFSEISKPFSEKSRILALNGTQVYLCNKSCAYLLTVK